jgi:hypothetical protein
MKFKILVAAFNLCICCLCLLTSQCVFPSKVAGNGSQAPNSAIVGMIYGPGGKEPASGDSVVLRSCDYLAAIRKLSKRGSGNTPFVRQMHTDDSGHYRFDSIPKGMYCIEAHDCNNRVLIGVDSSLFRDELIELPPDTLKTAANVWGKLLTGYDSTGTSVRIFGLDVIEKVGPDSIFKINNLPAGNMRLLISVFPADSSAFDTIVKIEIGPGVDTLLSLSIIGPKYIGPGTTFQKTLCDYRLGRAVQQTSDGGYVVTGLSQAIFDTTHLIKTDSAGTTIWARAFAGYNPGNSVQQTSDGGYIITGYKSVSGNELDGNYQSAVNLIKTDATGRATWIKTYNGHDSVRSMGECVQQTRDGGYIITGHSDADHFGLDNVILIKTDAVGTAEWTRTFGKDKDDYGKWIQQTSDGGYIIVGVTQLDVATGSDVYLIKTDSAGSAQWLKTIGGQGTKGGNSVQQTRDGGYFIAGYASGEAGGSVALWIKTDSIGTVEWAKTSVGSHYQRECVNSARQTSDGGFILAGYTELIMAGSDTRDCYVVKTDATGTIKWTKTFNGIMNYEGNSVWPTIDGGYAITGFLSTRDGQLCQIFLLKTDGNGNVN